MSRLAHSGSRAGRMVPQATRRGDRAGSLRGAARPARSIPTERLGWRGHPFCVYNLMTQSMAHARRYRFAGARLATLNAGLFGCKIARGSPLLPSGSQLNDRGARRLLRRVGSELT